MTAKEYELKIIDYTVNMLNYERTEIEDTIIYLDEDLKEYADDKILLKRIEANLVKSRVKENIINAEIQRRA